MSPVRDQHGMGDGGMSMRTAGPGFGKTIS
jgi:hypothetical protein